ncbi:hypothetical protein D3C78_1681220 [compost metagenome]
MVVEKRLCRGQPAAIHLAIAIDELHQLQRRQPPLQGEKAFVTRACGSERGGHVQRQYLYPQAAGQVR